MKVQKQSKSFVNKDPSEASSLECVIKILCICFIKKITKKNN